MLASTVTLIVLLCAVVLIPVPYAEMGPGPTVNTLGSHSGDPVLRISGHPTHHTSGHLNMTTVQVTGKNYRMNLVEALQGWLSGDTSVVSKEVLYPQDKSAKQIQRENAEEFNDSQEHAKVAALKHLDIPVSSSLIVKSVLKGKPAEGRLTVGDTIRTVDGKRVRTPKDVVKLVSAHTPGEGVTFSVVPARKGGKPRSDADDAAHTKQVTVRTVKDPRTGRALVGFTPGSTHSFPFDIDIKLADVGGPSAGLMFSLGLVDRLSSTDLTGGRFVAGTGTIDDQGKVGEIGGIELKTIAAARAGARYFLTPTKNCAAAVKDKPEGLTLVKVGSLDQATHALRAIRSGNTSALHTCAP